MLPFMSCLSLRESSLSLPLPHWRSHGVQLLPLFPSSNSTSFASRIWYSLSSICLTIFCFECVRPFGEARSALWMALHLLSPPFTCLPLSPVIHYGVPPRSREIRVRACNPRFCPLSPSTVIWLLGLFMRIIPQVDSLYHLAAFLLRYLSLLVPFLFFFLGQSLFMCGKRKRMLLRCPQYVLSFFFSSSHTPRGLKCPFCHKFLQHTFLVLIKGFFFTPQPHRPTRRFPFDL